MDEENTPLVPNLDESSQVQDLLVTINGIPIRTQNLIDFQINYSKYKKGRMSLLDTFNVAEFAPLTSALLIVSFTDAAKVSYEGAFIVTEVKHIRHKDGDSNIILKFEDVSLNALRNNYVSRSFSEKTMLEIFEDICKESKIPALFLHNKGDYVYENFVTPANISTLEFMERQMADSNIAVYSDRVSIVFASKGLMEYSILPSTNEKEFTLNYDSVKPYWNILEYEGITSNILEVQKAADANISRYNVSKLDFSPETINIESAYETEKINGFMGMKNATLPDLIKTLGKKEIDFIYYSDLIGDNIDYRDLINGNQKIKIAIQGLNIQRMFNTIKLDIPRVKYINSGENDQVYSNTYVITEVIDKFISGNFIQFLTLQASDYQRGSKDVWS